MMILDRQIGIACPPYIIAEMSGNHGQSLDVALAMIDAAAQAGVHAIKLQTYTADTMTLDINEGDFYISDPASLWVGRSMYDLYQEGSTPWEWHGPIMERAQSLGLHCFSSPFDETAVDFLESLSVPCYKIASFECVDIPLLRRVAQTGKPVIISTGMADLSEIYQAVDTIRSNGGGEVALLKCTSTYPADPVNSNVATIAHMRHLFPCEVGLSDHTLGVGVAAAAVAFGATIIEKHFTLDRNAGGVDAAFSMEPNELATLVREAERAWQSIGAVRYGATEAERKARGRRRSIYVSQDILAGEPLSEGNIRRIRPGKGLSPKEWGCVLGRKAKRNLRRGDPLSWDDIA